MDLFIKDDGVLVLRLVAVLKVLCRVQLVLVGAHEGEVPHVVGEAVVLADPDGVGVGLRLGEEVDGGLHVVQVLVLPSDVVAGGLDKVLFFHKFKRIKVWN